MAMLTYPSVIFDFMKGLSIKAKTDIRIQQILSRWRVGVIVLAGSLAAQSVYSTEIGQPVEKSVSLTVESTAAVIADDAVITDTEIRSYLSSVPEKDRAKFLADPRRLAESLQRLANTEQLALAGLEAGVLDDEQISAELYRAVAQTIARKHVDQVVESRRLDDYTQQAREYYLAHPDEFEQEPTYTFTHLLIGTSDRTESEAMRKLIGVLDELESDTSFDELVKAHSDDPGVSDNNGRYESVALDSVDQNVARGLQRIDEPGTISEPVRSRYGWHLIRLDEIEEGGKKSWEEAREEAVKIARQQHVEDIREKYTSRITDTSRIEIAPDLVERYQDEFGASGQ